MIPNYYASVLFGSPTEIFYLIFYPNVVLMCTGAFLFAAGLGGKSQKTDKAFKWLAKRSYGAYLVHALIIDLLNRFLSFNALSFDPIFAVPVTALVIFVISFLISAALNKIPMLKEWIV